MNTVDIEVAHSAVQPVQSADVVMCATGKSGLGHLRRVTNIAGALRRLLPDRDMRLVSNAPVDGMHDHEYALFNRTVLSTKAEMAKTTDVLAARVSVIDTAVLPGLHLASGQLCLILRETVPSRLHEFRLAGGRKWDLVLVPNPKQHWLPDADAIGANRVEPVGWIYRQAGFEAKPVTCPPLPPIKRILIASGGGGNTETSRYVASQCQQIISKLRNMYRQPLYIVQAAGPRMPSDCMINLCDEVIDPGPRLNELFNGFDLIISTAGYNSVLELAQTDRPVILLPISRSFDDQLDRSEKWAAQLGHAHQRDQFHETAAWAAQVLKTNYLRRPYDLGASGANKAASLLLELLR